MPPIILYPPNPIEYASFIFLAGTIDMGNSRDWQTDLVGELSDLTRRREMDRVAFANPRRKDWNSNWHADHPELVKQIRWELRALLDSALVFMWIEPNSKSPITLLELGLLAKHDKLVIGCPPDFYRFTNVKTTVEFLVEEELYDIEMATDWPSFVKLCRNRIKDEFIIHE